MTHVWFIYQAFTNSNWHISCFGICANLEMRVECCVYWLCYLLYWYYAKLTKTTGHVHWHAWNSRQQRSSRHWLHPGAFFGGLIDVLILYAALLQFHFLPNLLITVTFSKGVMARSARLVSGAWPAVVFVRLLFATVVAHHLKTVKQQSFYQFWFKTVILLPQH